MYKLFQNNIKQLNVGDVQGTLYKTFNCDLSYNKGKMSIAPRTRITTNTITNLGTPCAFAFFNGSYYAVMGTRLFKASSPQGAFTVVTAGGGSTYSAPTNCDAKFSDLTVFNGELIISSQDAIYRMNTSEQFEKIDGVSPALSNNVIRPVTVYNNRLYWTRLPYTVVSCDTSWAVSDTSSSAYNISISPLAVITFIKPHSVGLYIGTTRTDAIEGFVIDWNGETKNTPRAEYNVYAQGA